MKVFIIFGTRPEAIKMAPIIHQLKVCSSKFNYIVCITAQHREMLDQVLDLFEIVPDYDLDVMTHEQDLFDLTVKILSKLKPVLQKELPDVVLVQGDTTTAFVASLAAYYLQIPVGHVEAGLRTYVKYNPFPEEINRHMADVLTDYHFAPTEKAKSNLIRENIPKNRIWVTGNTVIDALIHIVDQQKTDDKEIYWHNYFMRNWNLNLSEIDRKIILVTGHRRESFGKDFKNICLALRDIAALHPEVQLIYPVHLNPNVQRPVHDILGPLCSTSKNKNEMSTKANIFLIDPLDYAPFIFLMTKAYLILTDSGGIQEEAPSLGKPVLVMRKTTERTEGIDAQTSRLVGTKKNNIVQEVEKLLVDTKAYKAMEKVNNPYGDGRAAERIVNILRQLASTSLIAKS